MKRERGVTLIELMVTVSITAILLAVAVPGFQQMMTSNTLAGMANDLLGALNYARSEAVKRGETVTICPSSNGSSCTGTWTQGWLVFVDEDADGAFDVGDDTRLHIREAQSGNYTIASTLVDSNGNSVGYLSYARNGTAATTGLFAICHDSETDGAQAIDITLTRPRIADDSSISTCAAP